MAHVTPGGAYSAQPQSAQTQGTQPQSSQTQGVQPQETQPQTSSAGQEFLDSQRGGATSIFGDLMAPSGPVMPLPKDKVREMGAFLDRALLPGEPLYTLSELSQLVGVSQELAADFWRWLGLPDHEPWEKRYTESDLVALQELVEDIRRGNLDESSVEPLLRSLGNAMERLASAQVEAVIAQVARMGGFNDSTARYLAPEAIIRSVEGMERQIVHAWRRQLARVSRRLTAEVIANPSTYDEAHQMPLRRAVGFADIVDFTTAVAHLNAHELAHYVQSFENLARDIVLEHGGRVIKTVGDAVLFVADTAVAGAQIALDLAGGERRHRPLGERYPVRVGLVWCRLLTRHGDVYGPGVNLASRLSDLSLPHQVTVDPPTAALLMQSPKFVLSQQPLAHLQGVGTMRPFLLADSDPAEAFATWG